MPIAVFDQLTSQVSALNHDSCSSKSLSRDKDSLRTITWKYLRLVFNRIENDIRRTVHHKTSGDRPQSNDQLKENAHIIVLVQ